MGLFTPANEDFSEAFVAFYACWYGFLRLTMKIFTAANEGFIEGF